MEIIMPQFFSVLATTAGFVLLLGLLRGYLFPSKSRVPLPPGPPARWLWQNAVPTVYPARTFSGWVAQYGPVVSVRQGRQTTIIVGSVDAATELLEKEKSSTADRPHLIAAREILSKRLQLLFEHNNDRFRRLRKVTQINLQPKSVQLYRPILLQEAKKMIVDILNDPYNHQAHTTGFATSMTIRVVYGKYEPTSHDDPEVRRIRRVTARLDMVLRPGTFVVDRFPFLMYLPGYGRQLNRWHHSEIELYRNLLTRAKSSGATENYVCRALLETGSEPDLSMDEAAYLAGTLLAAGSGTLDTAIMIMILAAATHPHAQTRVQEELDAIVGRDRIPSWEDAASLPQLNAFILEVARWRPVLPYGFPHRVSKDIIWNGLRIPADAAIYGSHWTIARDPVAFPDPENFYPQRWLTDDGQIRTDMKFYPFGFGRRVCPGMHLANSAQYIVLACLLWSFCIKERPDAPIDANAFSDTIIAHPAPFQVDFVPRIEERLLGMMMKTDEQ